MFQIIISIRNQSRINHGMSETFLYKCFRCSGTFEPQTKQIRENQIKEIAYIKKCFQNVTKEFLLILKIESRYRILQFLPYYFHSNLQKNKDPMNFCDSMQFRKQFVK